VNRNKEPAKGGFTMSTDNIFDGAVPSPAPIRLTFGEEGSPEIAVDDVIAQAEKAAAEARAAGEQKTEQSPYSSGSISERKDPEKGGKA
jgi:hypothetical protein